MKFDINPRLEFLLMICYFSEYKKEGLVFFEDCAFNQLIEQRFIDLKESNVVKNYHKMHEKGYLWSMLVESAFVLNHQFEIIEKERISIDLKYNIDQSFDEYQSYLRDVNEVYKESQFEDFIINEYSKYHDLTRTIIETFEKRSLKNKLEQYLGIILNDQRFVFSFFHKAFMGFNIFENNKDTNIVLWSKSLLEQAMKYNYLEISKCHIYWHESSHPIINPLIDEMFEDILNLSDQQVKAYCEMAESIIEGICYHLLKEEEILNDHNTEQYFVNCENNKSKKTRECASVLIEYENNRHIYPSIREFFPLLNQLFRKEE